MTPLDRMLEINGILRRTILRWGTEAQLQAGVAEALGELVVTREHQLGNGRIDFLCHGGIGVECKVDGSPSAVLRQLIRYADFAEVHGLLLVTSRSTHRFRDLKLRGKPFRVLWVGGFGAL